MLEKLFALKESDTSLRRGIRCGSHEFYDDFIYNLRATLNAFVVRHGLWCRYGRDLPLQRTRDVMHGIFYELSRCIGSCMGLNAYFVFDLCIGSGMPWQEALGIVFIAGMLFLILSFVGVRATIMNALPRSLQNAIAIGIGLFIAFIGLQMSGIITKDPATFITRGNLDSTPVLLSVFGIAVTLTLIARKVKGAILIGIFVSAIANLAFGTASFDGIAKPPPSIEPTLFKLQIPNIFDKLELIPVIFVFFAMICLIVLAPSRLSVIERN